MRITLPYGATELHATLSWAKVLGTLTVAETPPLSDPADALVRGLASPMGTAPLSTRLRDGGTVLIIVSDSFRKTGVHQLLPTLLRVLNENGIPDSAISFLFATGTHRGPTDGEQAEILGAAVAQRFQGRLYNHDPRDESGLVYMGDSTRGTPVYVNRRAWEATTVIATGTVVLHYFGGFGGGRKSIVPGIAGVKTIAANHSLNLDPKEDRLNPDVAIGRMAGNPVAEDMLECAKRCFDAFLINTILNRAGEIACIVCGDLEAAHDDACNGARDMFTVPVREKADFVVASAGSAKNFIQSHKSLYNAFQVVKPGGPIILATPATEGYGGHRFAEWIDLGSPEAIIAELRRNAEINGQTALSTLEKARNAVFVSEMSREHIEALGAHKAHSLDEALAHVRTWLEKEGIRHPTCYIMPDAPFSVPYFLGI